MNAELLINVTPQESRVGLLYNGILQEVHIERSSHKGVVGNIYKGRVCRVLPGMEAAFVDIGLKKAAFLHASDVVRNYQAIIHGDNNDHRGKNIADMLYEGMDILVQVIKDPLGTKGARLTTFVTIPSRSLVLVPEESTIGISSKIESHEERERLKSQVELIRTKSSHTRVGYIIRTAAEGATEAVLQADMAFLSRQWARINEVLPTIKKPQVVCADLPLVKRVLRDMVAESIERVRIDSRETVVKVKQFCQDYTPDFIDLIEHYPGERPIFDIYGVEDEIEKALERQVQLKSGGYLIIDQTESMTTIDVNTGRFVGHRNLEETIFKTNLEAAYAIARQLRLRNLGGIIIIDFIDMSDIEHRQQVLAVLEKVLANDCAKTYVSPVSQLGLVEMTRKRTRESLEHVLCESCSVCSGKGFLKTPQSICYEIFREILREIRQFDAKELLVLASQDVIDLLLDEESDNLAQLQRFVDRNIRFQVETLYMQDQYDIVLS
ncbi:MAG: ribonuclease G [Thiotrichaceae bacterium]|nr:ribonuclease G [Thiotrichaceae bacterium]